MILFSFFYAELIEMSPEVDDSLRVIVVRFSTRTIWKKKTKNTPTVIIGTDLK